MELAPKITGIKIQVLERILVLTYSKTGFAKTLLLLIRWILILVIVMVVMDDGSLWSRKRAILKH